MPLQFKAQKRPPKTKLRSDASAKRPKISALFNANFVTTIKWIGEKTSDAADHMLDSIFQCGGDFSHTEKPDGHRSDDANSVLYSTSSTAASSEESSQNQAREVKKTRKQKQQKQTKHRTSRNPTVETKTPPRTQTQAQTRLQTDGFFVDPNGQSEGGKTTKYNTVSPPRNLGMEFRPIQLDECDSESLRSHRSARNKMHPAPSQVSPGSSTASSPARPLPFRSTLSARPVGFVVPSPNSPLGANIIATNSSNININTSVTPFGTVSRGMGKDRSILDGPHFSGDADETNSSDNVSTPSSATTRAKNGGRFFGGYHKLRQHLQQRKANKHNRKKKNKNKIKKSGSSQQQRTIPDQANESSVFSRNSRSVTTTPTGSLSGISSSSPARSTSAFDPVPKQAHKQRQHQPQQSQYSTSFLPPEPPNCNRLADNNTIDMYISHGIDEDFRSKLRCHSNCDGDAASLDEEEIVFSPTHQSSLMDDCSTVMTTPRSSGTVESISTPPEMHEMEDGSGMFRVHIVTTRDKAAPEKEEKEEDNDDYDDYDDDTIIFEDSSTVSQSQLDEMDEFLSVPSDDHCSTALFDDFPFASLSGRNAYGIDEREPKHRLGRQVP